MLNYAPPKEIIINMEKAGKIHTDQERKAYVNIAAGVIKWALNDKGVMSNGARWVYSMFHIAETTPHYFFKYEVSGERLPAKFSILEYDEKAHKAVIPGGSQEDIRACISWLRDQGVLGEVDFLTITHERINNVLYFFKDYVYDNKVVFEDKKPTDIYKGIPLAENSSLGAVIRVPGPVISDYIDAKHLSVTPMSTIICQECGEELPCCKSAKENYCRACMDTMEHAAPISCGHVECSRAECIHYAGNIETTDEGPELDYYDRLAERRGF